MTVAATMIKMLNTAEPTMVATPSSFVALSDTKDIVEVKSSGADEPAAINVAPATSSLSPSFSHMISSDGAKKSSQMIAMPRKR